MGGGDWDTRTLEQSCWLLILAGWPIQSMVPGHCTLGWYCLIWTVQDLSGSGTRGCCKHEMWHTRPWAMNLATVSDRHHPLPTPQGFLSPTLTVDIHCAAEVGAAQGIGHLTGHRL